MTKRKLNPPLIEEGLKWEFQAAVEHQQLAEFRDLCLKHNPDTTYGKFWMLPSGGDKERLKVASVTEFVSYATKRWPNQATADMAAFIRILTVTSWLAIASSGLFAIQ